MMKGNKLDKDESDVQIWVPVAPRTPASIATFFLPLQTRLL